MAGYQYLSKFERGVLVVAREMRHNISEVVMKFGISRKINARVYRKYGKPFKTSNQRHHYGRKKIMQERD
ncbi:HTH_Tnp_Tc3_2 domain-containing protein [Trichonephila clavipes]|nr:HTH_Tnp_Tc3_2 domain-containing protein [Trichonephila clavipes]